MHWPSSTIINCVTGIHNCKPTLPALNMHIFLESWLLKFCQHTQQPSNIPNNSSIPFCKRLVCPCLPTPRAPLTMDLASIFFLPFFWNIYLSEFRALFYFCPYIFHLCPFVSPFRMSPQLYLITFQLSLSFMLSNIQHPRVFLP